MENQHDMQSRRMRDFVFLTSSLSLLFCVWCALETFSTVVFYWPFLKLVGYATIFLLLVSLSRLKHTGVPTSFALCAEMVVVCFLLFLAQKFSFESVPAPILSPPRLDIATTVEVAIRSLFVLHENPYNPSDLTRWTHFAGVAYPYGPMMLFGYLPSLWGGYWFKICSLLYLLGILVLSGWMAAQHLHRVVAKMAAVVFVVAVIMMPRAIWNDVAVGINDHFPVFLVLASLSLLRLKKEGAAGLFAGLSLSAKFSPAAFFIVLFLRRKLPVRFLLGVAVGCLPMLVFFAWEPMRFFHDVVAFHFTKSGTATSILNLVPSHLHNPVRALRLVCVAVFVVRNFDKEIDVKSVMYEYTLLMILINSLYLEMHSNHMLWILPTAAILLTQYRFRAWSLGRSVLGRCDAPRESCH